MSHRTLTLTTPSPRLREPLHKRWLRSRARENL